MHVNIIDVGNSKGIRLPKAVLLQCGIENGVDLSVEGNKIILRKPQKKRKPREGWREAMKGYTPEKQVWPYISNGFDEEGWQW